ncbi:hypothetical protein [Rodentibacter sp. Ppn85]|uniref:hypothetical protein n=1 Tax=Rodentibacter sp. Ppn85 TaxID=1908525 RepID=UPI000984DE0D|nr:hypothetical protein [Rodentibacter sp. Ppn85]OOF65160.1 hypothetical protein BKL51_06310 [Rodentibacter sp. Ppn85]
MLKESDLIEDHDYVSKNAKIYKTHLISWRRIFKVNHTQGYITYCEMKWLKNGFKATLKTISIKSFLRWAVADVTPKEAK